MLCGHWSVFNPFSYLATGDSLYHSSSPMLCTTQKQWPTECQSSALLPGLNIPFPHSPFFWSLIRVELHELIEQQGNLDNTLIQILLHNTCSLVKTKLQLQRRIIWGGEHSFSTVSMLMQQLLLKCPLETAIKPVGQAKEQQDNASPATIEVYKYNN